LSTEIGRKKAQKAQKGLILIAAYAFSQETNFQVFGNTQ